MNQNDDTPPQIPTDITPPPTEHETIQNSSQDSPEARQYVLIIYILYGIGVVTGLGSLIGVIMAYVKRSDLEHTVYNDHITYLIRTFWIAFAASIVGVITSPILIGFLILPLVFVWYVYRCVIGLIKFNERKPINPLTWF